MAPEATGEVAEGHAAHGRGRKRGAEQQTTIFLPYTPLGALFGFVPLPVSFVLLLLATTGAYLLASELVKGRFFRRFA